MISVLKTDFPTLPALVWPPRPRDAPIPTPETFPCTPLPHWRPSPPPASFIPQPFLNRATNGKREAESHRERRRRRCRPDTRPGRRGVPSPTARARGRPTSPVPRPVKGAGARRVCPPLSLLPTPSRRRVSAPASAGNVLAALPRLHTSVIRATRRVRDCDSSGFVNHLFQEIEYLKLR